MRGATNQHRENSSEDNISTHAPLAGRDQVIIEVKNSPTKISTHAPLAGRDQFSESSRIAFEISTHAPLAGRDIFMAPVTDGAGISTHAPLAGRDVTVMILFFLMGGFQPTRPLRGATGGATVARRALNAFQPTRPLRGATLWIGLEIRFLSFQPTRPLRGATVGVFAIVIDINISTHAPLAGRDSKSVQITMHIFAITDKFQMLLHRMPPVRAFCSFLMQENHADFGCEPPK